MVPPPKKSPPPAGSAQQSTDIAVALSYDPSVVDAPRVTASGRGAVAAQILQVAIDNGVEIRQDADLANLLSTLDVDSPIPLEAFAAVAEILAYIYRANGTAAPSADRPQES